MDAGAGMTAQAHDHLPRGLPAGDPRGAARDPRVFLMGEDVGRYGGCYAVTKGLLDEFGEERIRDTPLSESAFVGAGIGAAMAGMRPIVEIMTVNFSLLALDQIVNNAATIPHMSGGQFAVPLVIRMATGARPAARRAAFAQPRRLVRPYSRAEGPGAGDASRMRATCCGARSHDPNPGADLRACHALQHGGRARSRRSPSRYRQAQDAGATGRDVTLIAYGGSLLKTLAAAEHAGREGIEAEVIDLRVLRPLDTATILASVAQHPPRRDRRRGLAERVASAEIGMRIAEDAFFELDAPLAPGLQPRGADPLRHASGRCGPAAAGRHRRRRARPGAGRARLAMSDFRMPSLGADMEDGTLVEWLSSPATACNAAMSSPWSKRRRARSRSRFSTRGLSRKSSRGRDQGPGRRSVGADRRIGRSAAERDANARPPSRGRRPVSNCGAV